MNIDSEQEAKRVIQSCLVDPQIRERILSMFADAIIEANVYGRDKWAVHLLGDRVRLHVGHYIIFTIHQIDTCWLALDKQLIDSPIKTDLSFSASNDWGWLPDSSAPEPSIPNYDDRYGQPFSVNGYYKPSDAHSQIWPKLRRLHFEFIYKAVYIGQPIQRKTQKAHSSGVLKYLRYELGRHLPDPLYT